MALHSPFFSWSSILFITLNSFLQNIWKKHKSIERCSGHPSHSMGPRPAPHSDSQVPGAPAMPPAAHLLCPHYFITNDKYHKYCNCQNLCLKDMIAFAYNHNAIDTPKRRGIFFFLTSKHRVTVRISNCLLQACIFLVFNL